MIIMHVTIFYCVTVKPTEPDKHELQYLHRLGLQQSLPD